MGRIGCYETGGSKGFEAGFERGRSTAEIEQRQFRIDIWKMESLRILRINVAPTAIMKSGESGRY